MIVKIQNRRGQYVDFDPSKLLPGEFAIVQTGDPNTSDGKAIYIGVTSGNVKQLATLDELQSEVETALQSAIPEVVEEATQEAQDAADRAEAAAEHLVTDTTLTVAGRAADAKSTGDALGELNERMFLLVDNVPNTVQTYTFNSGSVSKVEHKNGNTLIRSDVFTYGETTITETRTLNTGDVLTIVTNLETLETIVTYTAA